MSRARHRRRRRHGPGRFTWRICNSLGTRRAAPRIFDSLVGRCSAACAERGLEQPAASVQTLSGCATDCIGACRSGCVTARPRSAGRWHTAGVSDSRGPVKPLASPSSGALFSTELYVAARAVAGLPPGLWHYDAEANALERLAGASPADAELGAPSVPAMHGAAAVLVDTAVFRRTGHLGRAFSACRAGPAAGRDECSAPGHLAALRRATRFGIILRCTSGRRCRRARGLTPVAARRSERGQCARPHRRAPLDAPLCADAAGAGSFRRRARCNHSTTRPAATVGCRAGVWGCQRRCRPGTGGLPLRKRAAHPGAAAFDQDAVGGAAIVFVLALVAIDPDRE